MDPIDRAARRAFENIQTAYSKTKDDYVKESWDELPELQKNRWKELAMDVLDAGYQAPSAYVTLELRPPGAHGAPVTQYMGVLLTKEGIASARDFFHAWLEAVLMPYVNTKDAE